MGDWRIERLDDGHAQPYHEIPTLAVRISWYALADRVEVIPLVEVVGTGDDAASLFKRRRR